MFLGLGVPELFICSIILGVLFLLIYGPLKRGFQEGYHGDSSNKKEALSAKTTAPDKSINSDITSTETVSSRTQPAESSYSIGYGAKNKDLLWKFGCLIGLSGFLWPVVAIAEKDFAYLGLAIGLFVFNFMVGFLFTLPFGLRPIPRISQTKNSKPRIIILFTRNILLLLIIGWYVIGLYYGIKLLVALGDLIYTTTWKAIKGGK